jgi:hypothetical protein
MAIDHPVVVVVVVVVIVVRVVVDVSRILVGY